MSDNERTWQKQQLAEEFLDEIRDAIPLAAEQIDVLMRIVRHTRPTVARLLDLGCGDGIIGRTVMEEYQDAGGVFLDLSEFMIETAKSKADAARATFVVQDLAAKDWIRSVADHAPFDLIVSSLAIHHLTDDRKQEVYQDIFDLLAPGGLFLNLEHVSLTSDWSGQVYNEFFVDLLWEQHRRRGGADSRDEIAEQWRIRHAKSQDLDAPVELQCEWLRRIGFTDVDCFFKIFQVALFGGVKAQ